MIVRTFEQQGWKEGRLLDLGRMFTNDTKAVHETKYERKTAAYRDRQKGVAV